VRAALSASIEPYVGRTLEAVNRVANLVGFGVEGIYSTDPSRKRAAEDVVRAAVVLLHAYLEDFLRTMAGALLPAGNEDCLNRIPLAGTTGRADKFLLGKLVQHKGKLVDDLLRESVSEYLERSNYNNTDEISRLLGELGIDVKAVSQRFPEIQRMMERRHQIVHRADRVKGTESNIPVLEPIDPQEVFVWLKAVADFMTHLTGEIAGKLNSFEDMMKRIDLA
jgi:RiboL-PSP-HEPN